MVETPSGISFLFVYQGLDTSEPVLQIGNNVYKGKFEDTFGSSLLFADEGNYSIIVYNWNTSVIPGGKGGGGP